MDVLAALSLAAADSSWTDDCKTCDWLRTEAAVAAIALSESPHCAIAVVLNATTNTDKAATLTPAMLWIVLNISIPFLPAIFRQFMPSSWATDLSPLDLRICDLVNLISSSFVINWGPRARPNLAHTLRLLLFFALLTNAQIARETSNDNRAASGHKAFEGME